MVQQRGKQEAVARGREDKPGRDKTEQKQTRKRLSARGPRGVEEKKPPQQKQEY